MYPKRMIEKHTGDSEIIYPSGKRTTEYPPTQDKLEDLIEENESEGSWDVGLGLLEEDEVKRVKNPPPDNGYPDEFNWDKKVLSSPFLSLLKPSAQEVLNTARVLSSKTVRNQIYRLLCTDPEWVEDLHTLLAK